MTDKTSLQRTGVGMVWLDLDDTLYDFKLNSHEALAEIYDTFHLDRYWADVDSWRDDYHKVNNRLWELYAPGLISRDYLRTERFCQPLTNVGVSTEEALAMSGALDEAYLASLGRRSATVPGAIELLSRLKKAGYRLGVLSNGFKEVQYGKMTSAGIIPYIDVVVLSDEIDVNKPNPRIYRYAEHKAGVSPDECIMIGDNPDTDIRGAVDAGWRAIYFNQSAIHADFPLSVIQVASLDDISPDILEDRL
ncbi:MAG: YjjG family noncanonical pyrimidine nucleotidase [Muribaculaceae bacterium]|nr:YjjG family noncanonical pyrimidine nucleotidase [Muribaculaceae bacterium]